MSEIEKMYENARVEKSKCWDDCNTCTRTSCDKNISYVKAEYPPFTAEKQIELIKFLMEDYSYYLDVIDTDNFENGLAASLNDLWYSLSEEEKQQVKGILE